MAAGPQYVARMSDAEANARERRVEAQLESSTMALYVSIVLLATLTAIGDDAEASHVEILGIVWGTTLGLAIAHFFAFRISSKVFRGVALHRPDVRIAFLQLGGALAVAVLCTVPMLLLPATAETDAVRLELSLLLGVAGYAAGRTGGASRPRALVTAVVVLVLGLATALLKNVLSGH